MRKKHEGKEVKKLHKEVRKSNEESEKSDRRKWKKRVTERMKSETSENRRK